MIELSLLKNWRIWNNLVKWQEEREHLCPLLSAYREYAVDPVQQCVEAADPADQSEMSTVALHQSQLTIVGLDQSQLSTVGVHQSQLTCRTARCRAPRTASADTAAGTPACSC